MFELLRVYSSTRSVVEPEVLTAWDEVTSSGVADLDCATSTIDISPLANQVTSSTTFTWYSVSAVLYNGLVFPSSHDFEMVAIVSDWRDTSGSWNLLLKILTHEEGLFWYSLGYVSGVKVTPNPYCRIFVPRDIYDYPHIIYPFKRIGR